MSLLPPPLPPTGAAHASKHSPHGRAPGHHHHAHSHFTLFRRPPPSTISPESLARAHQNIFALEFGSRENRSSAKFVCNAVAEDPEGYLDCLRYASPQLFRDPDFPLRALRAAADAFHALSEPEQTRLRLRGFGALNAQLADGACVLVDGDWLVRFVSSRPDAVLPRRQDLPPEAIFPGPVWGRVKVLAVSHVWYTAEHPDPAGQKLRDVARVVAWMLHANPG